MSDLTAAELSALDKWAEIANERRAIEEFFEWAGLSTPRSSPTLSDQLDRFYGVDRRSLETARQALLRAARAAGEKP